MKSFDEIYEKIKVETIEIEKVREPWKKFLDKCGSLGKPVPKEKQAFNILRGILIVVATFLLFALMGSIHLFMIISIVITIFAFRIVEKNNTYNKQYKEKVITSLIQEYDENLKYQPNRGVEESIFKQAGYETFDEFYSEDYIVGILKNGCQMDMAEVKTQKVVEVGSQTEHKVLFHGLFAQIILDKFIEGRIEIRKESKREIISLPRAELDSSEFEKIYNVYATDRIMAMQILTADIMQLFIDFEKEAKYTPEVIITKNKLYVRFNTGNVFETNFFDGNSTYSAMKQHYDIINFTLRLTNKLLETVRQTQL